MKHLLPLILACALLCGCGRTDLPEETVPILPTESVSGEVSEPEEYGGSVQTVPLNLRKVRGLRVFNGSVLLFSGQGSTTLTLLEADSLTETAAMTLTFQLEAGDPSLRSHNDGTLSFFDPEAEETVILNHTLEEIRRIPAPGALSGAPILSDDGKTLFYCTASHLRALNLETDIHRCVKEMSFDTQVLTGVLMDSSILQCQITEGDDLQTLFLSAEDGRLLHQGTGDFSLLTLHGKYYANLPAGTYRMLVFGEAASSPRMLLADNLGAAGHFLPEWDAAVTAESLPDDQVRLDCYTLSSGLLRSRLTLGSYQLPRSVEVLNPDTLVFLTYDPAVDQDLLVLWQPGDGFVSDVNHTEIYHPANAPDLEGLSQCRQQAAVLEEKYSIRILLWEDAVSAVPRNCTFEPEHLVPVLRQELKLLEQRLAHYPETLLPDTAAHFSSLNICLVRSVREAASGGIDPAVSFLDGSDAYLVIPAGVLGEQALYHGLFHLMETHIFSESKAFDHWDGLNPAGFQYDYDYASNALRDSGVYLFEENRAFVDTYAMSFPREDRARIMEYAMLPGQEALFRPWQMQAKLKQLCTGIREAYNLKKVPDTFLWEQYLE